MVTRAALACVCLACLSHGAFAQGEQSAPAANNGMEALAMRLEAKIDRLQNANDLRLAALEEKVKALSDVQDSNRQALQQIAQLDKDGKSYLRLDAQHAPTRRALRKAIEDVAPKNGMLIIQNKTETTQAISVNGITYDVLANSKRTVTVPYKSFEVRTSNNRSYSSNFNYPKTRALVDLKDASEWGLALR